VLFRSYTPFGLATPNGNPSGLGTFTLNDRFPGQQYDAESGLHLNYYRTYDPSTGRYLEADPIAASEAELVLSPSSGLLAHGVDANLYLYAGGSPVDAIDPTGLYYCVYSIGLHTMTCVPNNSDNQEVFSDSSFLSGSNYRNPDCSDCMNNENRTNVPNAGPIPPGFYTIGAQLSHSTRRRLTPDPRYQYDSSRFGFQTHFCPNPRKCSEGCIATPNMAVLNRLNDLLSLEEGDNQLTVLP